MAKRFYLASKYLGIIQYSAAGISVACALTGVCVCGGRGPVNWKLRWFVCLVHRFTLVFLTAVTLIMGRDLLAVTEMRVHVLSLLLYQLSVCDPKPCSKTVYKKTCLLV